MGSGDAEVLLEGYRTAFQETLARFDEPSLLRLRGELQVVSRWLQGRKEKALQRDVEAALDAVSRLYQFTVEVQGFAASRQAAETASMFDMGSIGVLGIENVLTAEKPTPMRLLMSGLSEGLMFLASRQYVKGSNEVLAATYRTHGMILQDQLWSLASDLRGAEDLSAIREARRSIDGLFGKLADPLVPVAAKVAVLHGLYVLVALLRCVRVLEGLEALP